MRFSAIHKATSYLMVAAAFAVLALSGELSPLVVATTIVAGALSFFAEPAQRAFLHQRWWSTLWTTATLLVFFVTVIDALRGEALLAGVRFLCFLLINKLWNRRTSRDYLQAYVVSLLMLIAGTVLNTNLAYAGCYFAYVVFATWTLTLFHLRREMEENYLLKHSDSAQSERVEVERILNSRRIVGGAFLAGTGLVSLGIFLGSVIVFFFIPRLGFGFFVAHGRRGIATAGFSDRVELGEYGLIKDNPQVVMRVELLGGPPDEPLHLRGISFDRYQRGRWSRTPGLPMAPLHRWGELALVDGATRPRGPYVRELLAKARVQNVYLEPLDSAVLFGASMPVAFQAQSPAVGGAPSIELEGRGAGEVYALERHVDSSGRTYAVERKSGLRYTVYSTDGPGSPRAASPAELAPYLALPDQMPSRIAELAHTLTKDATTAHDKAQAIESYLRQNFRYTLDLEGLGPCPKSRCDDAEPLDQFLFRARAGHCEYFASAMAILLRTVGVPTRSVNGFYGGEWNGYGHYLAVRQGDAHSWIEAFVDGVGWETFDPTPSAPPHAQSLGALHSLAQLLDTVELTWFKYVIEYDLGKQADLIGDVRASAGTLFDGARARQAAFAHRRALILLLAAAIAVAFYVRRRGRARVPAPVRRAARASHALERAFRALERRGYSRAASETARELALRAAAGADPGAAPFAELVDLYYAARFGGRTVAAEDLDRLTRAVMRPADGAAIARAPD